MKKTILVALLLSMFGLVELVVPVRSMMQAAPHASVTATAWTKSKSLLEGISRFPLMTQLVKTLQNAADPELSPCTNETALVTDPDDPQHLQAKAFIYTTETGNSSITIINRATAQDEILDVRPSQGTWAFHTQPSYAQEKPGLAENVTRGKL
jgi:hypothetical protein